MNRPSAIYPTPPKPEWFMDHVSGLRDVSLSNVSGQAGVPSLPPVKFTKMKGSQYKDYLAAHQEWLAAIRALDREEHDASIARRTLESYREVGTIVDAHGLERVPERLVPLRTYDQIGAPVGELKIRLEKKVAHPPVLSTQPHRSEKRNKKKLLRDAKVKASVNVLQAKTELVTERSVPLIKEELKNVAEVKRLAPLHKVEVKAAKSAETRAASLMKSSPQFITEVKPDDGWKVVLHKKDRGPVQILRDEVTVPNTTNGRRVHTTVSGAGTSPADLLRTAGAATRLPTAVRS